MEGLKTENMSKTFNTSTATLTVESATQGMITTLKCTKIRKFENASTKADHSFTRKPILNPLPLWMETKLQKLQKSKCVKKKKQKSEKAKTTTAAIADNVKPTEIMNLDTDNESNSSDITMIATLSPITVTVEDSADDEKTATEFTASYESEETDDIGGTSHKIRQKRENKKSRTYNTDGNNEPESSKSNSISLETNKENLPSPYNISLSWNNEMRVLYNDSWQTEPFIMHELLQKMNPDRDLWNISLEDRCNIASNERRYNPKCTNCNQFGHNRSQCNKPRKPIICYMCGESGHNDQRCPNSICLKCGKKTQGFVESCNYCIHQNRLTCSECQLRGHSSDYCPNIWRKYHSTTEQHIKPNNTVNNNPRKYCCNCGASGHLSDDCRRAVHSMEYPRIVSTIRSNQRPNGGIKRRC